MPNSSAVTAGTAGAASQYNNVRLDTLDVATGHDHTGSVGHGVYCGGIPIGGIIIWSGAIAAIPANYVLCNGTGGTPDLQEKFVVCAGGSYAVNATGGATTKNLAHTHGGSAIAVANESSHTHAGNGTLATGTAGSHNHVIVMDQAGDDQAGSSNTFYADTAGSHSHTSITGNTAAGGAHNHTLSGSTASGGSATQDILATWYALAYVQRIT
jgi:hypothetical protein